MTLWAVIALMTAAAMFAMGWPLTRRSTATVAETEGDVAVYRDQMAEIERDCAAGAIGVVEAEAARAEVSRRLIAAADAGRAQDEWRGETSRGWRLASAGALVAVPVCGVGLYLALGSPNLPGEPLEARIAQAHGGDQSVESLFTKVEAHLEQNPDDGRGWEVIAPVYMRLGRYDEAVRARTNALRLLGSTADRVADLGEALVAASNGVVTADAKAAFDEAVRLDTSNVTARFYEGLAAEQDGDRTEAARLWHALLDSAPQGAQWANFVRQALARLDSAAVGAPSPSEPQMADGQDPMVLGMVERLAARLHRDGSDVEGWIQLVRSHKVLGEKDKMSTAVADAKLALANDPEKLRRLDEGVKSLDGVPSAAGTPAVASEANASVPPGQDRTIAGMVARLDARLHRDGSDVEGWIRLVRSYKVLGEKDKMSTAVADAKLALANDPEKLRRLDEGVESLDAEPSAAMAPLAEAAPAESPPAAGTTAGVDPTVRGMVDRLGARLHRDGSDVEGWIQLVRSYKVLGEKDKMSTAVADAKLALASDPEKLHRLDEGVKNLDAESSAAASPPPAESATIPAAGATAGVDPMVRGMVDRLDARLHRDGSDVEGWIQLVRSYKVLGELDRMRAAIADARQALSNDPQKLRRLDEGVKGLGVGG